MSLKCTELSDGRASSKRDFPSSSDTCPAGLIKLPRPVTRSSYLNFLIISHFEQLNLDLTNILFRISSPHGLSQKEVENFSVF